MACGILLITHPGVGNALLAVATTLLRTLPLRAEAFEVPFDADLDQLLPTASAALRRVDGGDGVLVLTDLYGASPSNLGRESGPAGNPGAAGGGVEPADAAASHELSGTGTGPPACHRGGRYAQWSDHRRCLNVNSPCPTAQPARPRDCQAGAGTGAVPLFGDPAGQGARGQREEHHGRDAAGRRPGTPVTVRTEGEDEATAMAAIASLFERRFDEDA